MGSVVINNYPLYSLITKIFAKFPRKCVELALHFCLIHVASPFNAQTGTHASRAQKGKQRNVANFC